MTPKQRRFATARDNVERLFTPYIELLNSAQAAVVEANERATLAEIKAEVLREQLTALTRKLHPLTNTD